MLVLSIDNGEGPIDYSHYVDEGSIQIQDSINVPTLLNFILDNVDDAFVMPVQGAYCTLYSTIYSRNVVTGFVTNQPEVSYLGRSHRVPSAEFQMMQFAVQVTSDEWLLNVKAVPFLPAFVSQSQGQILAALAEILAPGFFDTSLVQDGVLVPYFKYDPTQKWSDIAKQFGDASRYRYKVVGRQIVYAPFGDAPLGVSYDDTLPEATFDPSTLQSSILTVPPVNEAIVVGDVEPQTMWDDYFIGDGFTGNFDLRHKVFNGATNALLEDDWTEQAFNTQYWLVQDPFGNFLLSQGGAAVGALNVVTSLALSGSQLGQSYILGQNGIELGGHLALQHGDFTFVDVSVGLIGGVFSGQQLTMENCVAAFSAFTASGDVVVPSPSGAQNVSIQPVFQGTQVGPIVKTKINHQYLLFTYINARQYTRFTQPYTSLAGTVFGGQDLPALADVTFVIQDIDETVPWNPPLTTTYTASGQLLPSFGTYAIINNQALNLNVNFTLLSQPPQGQLSVMGLTGVTGSQLPIFGPGVVPAVSGFNVPAGISGAQQTQPTVLQLGFGMGTQSATVTNTNGDADELSFYAGQVLQSYVPSIGGVATNLVNSTIPSPGERVRFTSWDSGRALADVQDPILVADAAVIDGDDGRRMAVFTDLNPLPRTSDECEQAAMAQIADRSAVQYQGTYTATSLPGRFDTMWSGFASDYPFTGRILPVNSPQRNILRQNLLVTQVLTTVTEMHDEVMTFQISFGQDLFLEKLLSRFIPNPANVITPNDAAIAPTLQFINEVGTVFLDDLVNAQATIITGALVNIDLGAPPVTGCEVRRADYGWGTADQNLVGVFTTQSFVLPRTAYETVYYMRQRNGPLTSRFTRAIRVVYPLVPTAPGYLGVNETDPQNPVFQLQFSGDIRNIRGLEIRGADNATVIVQKTILSIADLAYTFQNITGAINISLYAYFFNLMWEYSPPTVMGVNPTNFFGISALGPNLISNPSFEKASLAYATGLAVGSGQFIVDQWAASGSQQMQIEVEVNGEPRTGQKCGLVELATGQTIAASGTVVGSLFYPVAMVPTSCVPTKGGDYNFFGGYAKIDGLTITESDNFVRANGPLGSNWAAINGNPLVISSDTAVPVYASGNPSASEWVSPVFSSTQRSQATLAVLAAAPAGAMTAKAFPLTGTNFTTLGYAWSNPQSAAGTPDRLYAISTAVPEHNLSDCLVLSNFQFSGALLTGVLTTLMLSVTGGQDTGSNIHGLILATPNVGIGTIWGGSVWPQPNPGIVIINCMEPAYVTLADVLNPDFYIAIVGDNLSSPTPALEFLVDAVSLTIQSTNAATNAVGVAVRMSSSTNDYYAFEAGLLNYQLVLVTGGINVQVLATVPQTPQLNDVIELMVEGSSLTASVNGIVVISLVDKTLSTGQPGIAGWVQNPTVVIPALSLWSAIGVTSPAGLTLEVGFRLWFYDTNGVLVEIAEVDTPLMAADIGTGYQFLEGLQYTPEASAYMQFECRALVTNTNSTPFTTGATVYVTARFDDVQLEKADRGVNASYRPLGNPLTAVDDGTSCTVSMSEFFMRAGSTDVLVDAGAITSLAYGTLWYVYYDDPSFAGGAVTFNVTQIKEIALLGEYRFFVGSIFTPTQGGASTIGNNDGGAGAQVGQTQTVPLSVPSAALGTGTATNLAGAYDGNLTTFATFTFNANGSPQNIEYSFGMPLGQASGPTPATPAPPFGQMTVLALLAVTINNLTGAAASTVVQVYAQVAGVNIPILSLQNGQTVSGATLYEALLPTGVDPTTVFLFVNIQDTVGYASGTLALHLYEVWALGQT